MKPWLYWGLTLAVALVTGTYVYLYLDALQDTVPVLVAVHDIPPGSFVESEDVRVADVHRSDRYPGAMTDRGAVVGRYALGWSYDGEQLENRRFAPGPAAGLSATLSRAESLIFIPASSVVAVGGQIRESDRVDVYFYTEKYEEPGEVRLLLQGLTVVQAVRETALRNGEEGELTGVLVAVTPEQAQQLILALETGVTYLSLSAYDAAPIYIDPLSLGDVLRMAPPVASGQADVNPSQAGEGVIR